MTGVQTCALPISTSSLACSTAVAWYRGELPDVVQLLYPDRNGFMPYETGFDQRMRLAQPVVGTL